MDGEVIFDLNFEEEKTPPKTFCLSKDAPDIANVIKDNYSLYNRWYIFTPKNTYPNFNKRAGQASLHAWSRALFTFTGKRVSVHALRSSYVSYMVHQAMLKGNLLSAGGKK